MCVCVCVWLKFQHAFSIRSSPAVQCSSPAQNTFVSMCVWLKFQHAFSIRSSPALQCSSPAQNTFVSNVKSAHPQHKTRSSLAINLAVRGQCDLHLEVFVYIVKSCSEMSSRDCLIASDQRFCFLFGSWLETPRLPQKIEPRGKTFLKELHFKLGLDL